MPGLNTGRTTGLTTARSAGQQAGFAWAQWRVALAAFLQAGANDQPWKWDGGPPVNPRQGHWTLYWNNPNGPQTELDFAVVRAMVAYNAAVDAVMGTRGTGDDGLGFTGVDFSFQGLGRRKKKGGGKDDELLQNQTDQPVPEVYGLTLADQLDGVRTGRQPQAGDGVQAALGIQIGQTSMGGGGRPANEEGQDERVE